MLKRNYVRNPPSRESVFNVAFIHFLCHKCSSSIKKISMLPCRGTEWKKKIGNKGSRAWKESYTPWNWSRKKINQIMQQFFWCTLWRNQHKLPFSMVVNFKGNESVIIKEKIHVSYNTCFALPCINYLALFIVQLGNITVLRCAAYGWIFFCRFGWIYGGSLGQKAMHVLMDVYLV